MECLLKPLIKLRKINMVKLFHTLKIVYLGAIFLFFVNYAFSHGDSDHKNQLASTESGGGNYKAEYSDYTIPDVSFYDQNSQSVSITELLGNDKPVMLNFIFTSCPTICPVLTSTFAKLQSSFEKEQIVVQLVSVSIDPEHDTPSVLHDYAAKFNASSNWAFLTGNSSDIESLQKSFDSFRGDKMSHSPVLFMRAAATDTWLKIEGFPSVKNIIDEFRQLDSA